MLSIVTPVYNGEAFLRSCIENVIAQDCKNLEHIIVDGNSTDETLNIVKSYASDHTHIRWLSEDDLGQSDAINKGILMARGEVVGILNVDDYYEPDSLNYVLDFFSRCKAATFLVGRCHVWSSEKKLKYTYHPKSLRLYNLLLGQKFHPTPVNPVGYFYHRVLHDTVGLYDVTERYAMDFDFIYRMIPHARVQAVDRVLGSFRYFQHTKTYQNLVLEGHEKTNRDIRDRYIQQLSSTQKICFKCLRYLSRILLYIEKLTLRSQLRLKTCVRWGMSLSECFPNK